MKQLLKVLQCAMLVTGMCFVSVTTAMAADENNTEQKEIDISLLPKEALFTITNMKPGDWAPRTITVINTGSKDFSYQMQVQNSGDKKLFNELLMEVKAGDVELYNGKLAKFNSIAGRKLATGTEENLDITIRFPEHLGNEFQNASSSFVLIFTAEGNDGTPDEETTTGGIDNEDPTPPENIQPTTPSDGNDNKGPTPPEEIQPTTPTDGNDNKGPTPPGNIQPATPTAQTTPTGGNDNNDPTPPGNILPTTSTNIFNLLLAGAGLTVAGIVLMGIRFYRRMKLTQ